MGDHDGCEEGVGDHGCEEGKWDGWEEEGDGLMRREKRMVVKS